jgi:hypothetical protein
MCPKKDFRIGTGSREEGREEGRRGGGEKKKRRRRAVGNKEREGQGRSFRARRRAKGGTGEDTSLIRKHPRGRNFGNTPLLRDKTL